MSEIMVSINCITYNQQNYIKDAIESFLMQKTDFKFEILIHDDASTDKTRNIIKQYEQKYPEIIKPIYQTDNQYSKGIKISHINGLRAKGKYMALCEGDDYWTNPNKLQRQVDYMEKNASCTLCTHSATVISTKKSIEVTIRPYVENTECDINDIIIKGGYFLPTVSLLYPRKLMENPPKFYLDASAGDYPLQMYLSSLGYAYYIDDSMAVYRADVEGSWSSIQTLSSDSIDKEINHARKVMKTLNDFNIYTDFKYNDAINSRINHFKIQNLIRNKDIKTIKLQHRDYYDSLNIKNKIIMYLRVYLPRLLNYMVKIKNLNNGL